MPETKNIPETSATDLPSKANAGTSKASSALDSGKISKIVGTAKSVTEELAHVVDLKVKLVQTDIEEKVNEKVNTAIQKSIGYAMFGMVGLFSLIGIAAVIGELLGNYGYGFLLVALALLLATLIARSYKPKWFHWQMDRVDIRGLIGQGVNKVDTDQDGIND